MKSQYDFCEKIPVKNDDDYEDGYDDWGGVSVGGVGCYLF